MKSILQPLSWQSLAGLSLLCVLNLNRMLRSNPLLLGLLALIWGSSFILIKKGLIGLAPAQLAAIRILSASLLLVVLGGRQLKHIRKAQWPYVALSAFLGTFFPAFLFAWAETGIDSGLTSLLNALTPLQTLWTGALLFGFGMQRKQGVGLLLGLAGTALLVFRPDQHLGAQGWLFPLAVVLATLLYGMNINVIKRHLSDCAPLALGVGNFVVMVVPAVCILCFLPGAMHWEASQTQTAVAYVALLGVLGTGIANLLYFRLIQQTSPLYASWVTYLIPIVALGWGLSDGEQLYPQQGIGALLVLGGIAWSQYKR